MKFEANQISYDNWNFKIEDVEARGITFEQINQLADIIATGERKILKDLRVAISKMKGN